jgi:cytochrome c peroxidase
MRKTVILLILSLWLLLAAAWKPTGRETHPFPFPVLQFFPPMPSAADNPVTVEGAELGRYLFYDPILSADSTMKCASCHRQEAAFSDAPVRFSRDRSGKPLRRNTPPLFNLAWYPRLFWDGRAANVEDQVLHPVRAHEEMNLQWPEVVRRLQHSDFYMPLFRRAFGDVQIDSILITKAVAQFERTLISYQSRYDRVLEGKEQFTSEEYEGFEIVNDMAKGDCLHCHTTDNDALGVNPSFSNNGLDTGSSPFSFSDKGYGIVSGAPDDNGKFKVPSLRNIALTPPYMHDGRFSTLSEVLRFYSEGVKNSATIDSKMEFVHQGGVRLSASEQSKVIAFLKTLTDSAFIKNPAFGDPFKALH